MSYVIVDRDGGLYKKPGHISNARYSTSAAAGVALKHLLIRDAKRERDDGWYIMEANAWREAFPVKMVTRRNLMSGIEYEEAEDTPLCCSPSSETYWSM